MADEKKLIELVNSMQAALTQIKAILEGGQGQSINQSINLPLTKTDQDQDLDQDHNHQIRSDQIRSDQIRSAPAREAEFVNYCNSLGIDLSVIDIRGIDRNIAWLMDNLSTIRAPKSYILKMISACPIYKPKVVGFQPPVSEDNSIMGYSPEAVDAKIPYLDARTYMQIREKIPGYQSLFANWAMITGSAMKMRVVTAYCMREGLL